MYIHVHVLSSSNDYIVDYYFLNILFKARVIILYIWHKYEVLFDMFCSAMIKNEAKPRSQNIS